MTDISDGIQFRRDGVDPNQWPKLSCSEANQLALGISNLRLDAQREILFQGNGQFNASGDMLFLTGGSSPEKLSILANGNVGIGKSEPEAKLEVNGNLKLQQGVAVNEFSSDSNLSDNSELSVPTQKAVKTYVDFQIGQVNHTLSTKAALAGASSQDFHTHNLTVSGNLTTTGNVGIGTSDPKAKLEVAGDVRADVIQSNGGFKFPDGTVQTTAICIASGLVAFDKQSGVITNRKTVQLSGFKQTPTCFVALATIDADRNANLRINAYVENITKSSFEICLTSWADTTIWWAQVAWIAFGS